jgi:anaerobic selenocysteine-containing dehydrogenase
METGKPYPIKGLWCQTNNFIAGTAQDPRRHYEAVRKLEFNVVVDTFMTPTAQAIADIVLPAAAITEKDSAFTTGVPCNPIYKVAETEEARMDWEINFELARRLNPDAVPWPNVKALLDQRLSVTGHTFESLKEAGYCLAPKGDPTTPYMRHEKGLLRPDGQPGFRTPSGKFEFYSQKFEEYGLNPLPHHVEPIESEVSTPDIYKEYPLIMITGRRVGVMFHSEHRMIPWLREINPDPQIEIHPDTALKNGIKDGDWVLIEGTMGKAKRKAVITPLTHPGIVLCQHGWWIPEAKYEGDGNPYKVWDINVNQLIPMGKNSKSGFGGAFTKTMLCKISKVKEGEEVSYV